MITIEEIIQGYQGQPAPVLPILHAIQKTQGYISRAAVEAVANALGIPVADLYSAVSFYAYLRIAEDPAIPVGVCAGLACRLAGARPVADSLRRRFGIGPDGRSSDGRYCYVDIPCPGLCDRPVAVLVNGVFYAGGHIPTEDEPAAKAGLPWPTPHQEAVLPHAQRPQHLEAYRGGGGYWTAMRTIRELQPWEVAAVVKESGLVGRGGAGFPAGVKWEMVRRAKGRPKYLIANADEGEPGTFKDRAVLEHNPHRLLEGMIIAAYAVGAAEGIIYLRYEYPAALAALEEAIAEAAAAGLLGDDVGGTGMSFRVHLRRGAGAYICGEETSLLNSLEGVRPLPRDRPPYPTTHGLYGRPTLVHNVETLAALPAILDKGAQWFRSLGRGDACGTKVYSVSGRVNRPGNYELPLGITARELIYDWAGGIAGGRELKAFTLGGISGGLVGPDFLEVPLDYRQPSAHGVFLGSGGIIVLDEGCCLLDMALACLSFFEHESCGKCFPCRIGTVRLREFLEQATGRREPTAAGSSLIQQAAAIADVTATGSACGLGPAAALVVQSLLRRFRTEVEAHLLDGVCPAGLCF